jgi:hypothetical protein
VALILGFFMLWDLPEISRGVASLKQVRRARALDAGRRREAARQRAPPSQAGGWAEGGPRPALSAVSPLAGWGGGTRGPRPGNGRRWAGSAIRTTRDRGGWPIDGVARTVRATAPARQSRLAPIYEEVAPVLGVFGKLFGKALEAQVGRTGGALTGV